MGEAATLLPECVEQQRPEAVRPRRPGWQAVAPLRGQLRPAARPLTTGTRSGAPHCAHRGLARASGRVSCLSNSRGTCARAPKRRCLVGQRRRNQTLGEEQAVTAAALRHPSGEGSRLGPRESPRASGWPHGLLRARALWPCCGARRLGGAKSLGQTVMVSARSGTAVLVERPLAELGVDVRHRR